MLCANFECVRPEGLHILHREGCGPNLLRIEIVVFTGYNIITTISSSKLKTKFKSDSVAMS